MSNPKKEKKEMKKILLSMGLMLAALTLTNCSNEIDENINANTDGANFELTADIDTDRAATNSYNIKWEKGDALNLYHAVAGTTTYTNDAKFAIDETDLTAGRFTGKLGGELTAEAYDWYAFYPYDSYLTAPTGANYTQLWAQNQVASDTDDQLHIAKSNNPLYGVAKGVSATAPLAITMKPLGTMLKINLINVSDEDLEVSSVDFATTSCKITGSYKVNFTGTTPVVTKSDDTHTYNNVNLKFSCGAVLAEAHNIAGDCQVFAAVAPFTAPAGEVLTITVVTDKGSVEVKKTLSAATEFKPGVVNTINVEMEAVEEVCEEFPYTETFATNLGKFTINDVSLASGLSYVWKWDSYKYAKGSAYAGGNKAAESWLVSPLVDLTSAKKPVLTFDQASFSAVNGEFGVYAREKDGEWTALTVPTWPTVKWAWVNSGNVDLSAFAGKKAQIAFKYTSTSSNANTWEIKNVKICEAPFSMSATAPAEFPNTASNGSFAITTENADGYTITAALKDATQTWISNIAVANNTVTFSVAANTGNARGAAIVVTATNGTTTKTVEVAISQAAGASAAETADIVVDLTKQGFANEAVMSTIEAGDITVKFAGGGNSNGPKYYTSGTAVRMYPKNTFTVSAGELTMTKIVLTFPSGYTNALDIIANKGSYSSGTWTGSASEVQFQLDPTKTSGQSRLVKITITYIPGEDGPAVVLQDRGLKFSATTATATLGSTFTAPTLSGVTDGVTYTSSNAAVATVNATTGAVTLVGAGSTTIKAAAAENDTYKAGEASYTLTVNAAGEASYTLQFGSSYNSKGVSGYTGVSFNSTCNGFTWTIANANNNNSGWNYIKIGSKNGAYTGTITTSKAIPEAIKTVTMTVDACTTSYVTSIKMYVASDSNFSQNLQTISVTPAKGNLVFTVPTPTENSFYKIEVACAKASSNGPIQISKVVYTTK